MATEQPSRGVLDKSSPRKRESSHRLETLDSRLRGSDDKGTFVESQQGTFAGSRKVLFQNFPSTIR